MKYSITTILRVIIISLIFSITCFKTNAVTLTFCTKYVGSGDSFGYDISIYNAANWKVWMPNISNVSDLFYLYDIGTANTCGTTVSVVHVNDNFKNLLMTNENNRLLQINPPGLNTALQIALPPLSAPHMKYCSKFLVTGTQSGAQGIMNISVTPIECNFPTSISPKQINARSYK